MTRLSVIIPASNEASLIGACLDAITASHWHCPDPVEAIVVANGCRDATADVAWSKADAFAGRGWTLRVIERAEGGKIGALNAGDAAASGRLRAYLDADVTLSAPLLAELVEALDVAEPRYASGTLRITARGLASRAYARIWAQVPFMAQGVPGAGLFAVNAPARQRWGAFPEIISDDTFVRLHFAPEERVATRASYDWPVAEGLGALLRVRRRQDRGVDEVASRFPTLLHNEGKASFPAHRKLWMALRDPLGFATYSGIALASRLTRNRADGWSRGR